MRAIHAGLALSVVVGSVSLVGACGGGSPATCTVTKNADGTGTVKCTDGTSVSFGNGEAGPPGPPGPSVRRGRLARPEKPVLRVRPGRQVSRAMAVQASASATPSPATTSSPARSTCCSSRTSRSSAAA